MAAERAVPTFPRLLKPIRAQPPVYLNARERDGAARNELMIWVAPHSKSGPLPGARPASPAMQRSVAHLFDNLSEQATDAWGMNARLSPGVAVVKGGCAEDVILWTLSNGSVLLSQATVELARRVGVAAAKAHAPADLLVNLVEVAYAARAGDLTKPGPEPTNPRAKALGDAFLASIIGHELTHAAHQDGVRARPVEKVGPIRARVREVLADAGGIELAARAGASPLGAALPPLYFSALAALAGESRTPAQASHPRADRYKVAYIALSRALRAGLLSKTQQRDLALLPSRRQTQRFLQRVAGTREVR